MDENDIALQSSFAGYLKEIGDRAPTLGAGNVLNRFQPLSLGWHVMGQHRMDHFVKQIDGPLSTEAVARDLQGKVLCEGVNFASQDYLSLACHPRLKQAAHEAIERFGVQSSGTATLMGNTPLSVSLEQRLKAYLRRAQCNIFPTGWAAAYGSVRTLARTNDHVVLDQYAHTSLWEGARAATRNLHTFTHLSVPSLIKRLKAIREIHPGVGIIVVTESLFSMDADSPDLAAHIEACRQHGATLVVDIAHDLGSMGPQGLGVAEQQGVLNDIDVLVGSFSKTFGGTGGFVATNEPGFGLALRFGCPSFVFAAAMSPAQTAIALAALDVVQSPEGQQRRDQLAANAQAMCKALSQAGWRVLGQPSAIVPVLVGGMARSRLLARHMLDRGMIVNLIEHPAVPLHASRLRLQMMADHRPEHIQAFVQALQDSAQAADRQLAAINATRAPDAALV